MNVSRRRTAGRWLTVVALGAIALTGCSQNSADRMDPATPAKPVSSSPSTENSDARSDGGKNSVDPVGATKKASPSPRTSTRPESGEAPKETSAPTGRAPFAGTEQFVTVRKAWTGEGRTYLAVRPAQKKINTRFDTWEIVPGRGAFTTVTMAEDARVLLTTPVRDEVAGGSRAEPLPYSPAEFVTLLNRLDSGLYDGIGFDLVFDGAGQVTGLKSLYRP